MKDTAYKTCIQYLHNYIIPVILVNCFWIILLLCII